MKEAIIIFCVILIFVLLGLGVASYAFPPFPFNAQPQSFARVNANTIQALTNQNVTLTSQHYAFIFNDTAGIAIFTYSFSLCAELQPACALKTFNITMQPHQSININYDLPLQAIWNFPRLYWIKATTTIVGPATNVLVTSFSNANIIPPYYPNALPFPLT